MKQALLYDLTNRLNKVKGITNKHFKPTAQGRSRKQLEFSYNNKNIRIVNVYNNDFMIFINNKPYSKNDKTKFNNIDDIISIIKNIKLEEKASIDWNNFLTSEEVKRFLSKDDKVESAEEIIYDKDGPWHQKYWCDFQDDWTKRELVQDLANFYHHGHLIVESNNQDKIDKYIEDNTNKLIGLKDLAEKVRVYISTVGRKYNSAKYDYERNKYKRQQEFYREVLTEINKRLNKTESKHKIEEKSRNELLAKAKAQTITRYNKSQEYKGFYIRGVDTAELLKKDSLLTINCQVGNYRDQVQMENMLYWVEYEIEERNHDLQVTTKYVTQALMDAIDGMNIKVNCECGDWKYRMAYQATKYGYKYGTPENRPAKIRNPNDMGSMCKHLISILSNKKWLQQVTSILMDFIVDNIDKVNQFLRRQPGKEFTTPNAEARALGKQSVYKKFLNRQELIQEVANEFIKESEDKLFTMNTNLDDDLQRFINDNYSVQKITAQEFKVIRELINNYIQENKVEEPEESEEENYTEEEN